MSVWIQALDTNETSKGFGAQAALLPPPMALSGKKLMTDVRYMCLLTIFFAVSSTRRAGWCWQGYGDP